MRTVIYARKSTLKEGQKDTLENQIKICKRRAKELGLQIVGIKKDSSSGRTDNSREEVKELIKGAIDGEYECVIMKGVSRFYRDVEHGLGLIKRLDRSNVRVITVEESFDSSKQRTGSGQLDTSMITMYLMFAENESKKTAERIKYTQIEKAHSGEWNQPSSVPYGYKYNPETKKLEIDITSSYIIKKIYELYLEGMGMRVISHYLSGENPKGKIYPTARGGKWNQYTVGYILKNQVYVGDVVYNKRSRNSRPYKKPAMYGKTEEDLTHGADYNKKEDWIVTKNAHESIIDRETFDKVQNIISTKSQRKGIKGGVSLLAGIAKCGKCGTGLTFKRGDEKRHGRDRYYCSNYIKYGKRECDHHSVIANDFEKLIIGQLISKIKERASFLEVTKNLSLGKTPAQKDELEIKRIEAEIRSVSRKTDILLEKNIEGALSDSQFSVMNKKFAYDMERLSEHLENLKIQQEKNEDDIKTTDYLLIKYNEVVNIEELKKEEQRYLISDLINKIVVVDGEIEIEYKF